jgi:3-deoxy-D-manno-octulosonate cytidylyltransferase
MPEDIKIIGIIPSRIGSTRLPGKPLLDIKGKPLIQRVWEAVSTSKLLEKIIIATDDDNIFNKSKEFTDNVVMTSPELPSGTDRIMQAYNILKENADVVVNIQGDEPLIKGEIIDDLLIKFIKSDADVGTIVKKISNRSEIDDTSVVKVQLNPDKTANKFSRIPFKDNIHWKHIGIYAYKIEALKKFVSLPVSESEKKERLEQLRLMEAGAVYYCMETDADLIGVDTIEDLERVRRVF